MQLAEKFFSHCQSCALAGQSPETALALPPQLPHCSKGNSYGAFRVAASSSSPATGFSRLSSLVEIPYLQHPGQPCLASATKAFEDVHLSFLASRRRRAEDFLSSFSEHHHGSDEASAASAEQRIQLAKTAAATAEHQTEEAEEAAEEAEHYEHIVIGLNLFAAGLLGVVAALGVFNYRRWLAHKALLRRIVIASSSARASGGSAADGERDAPTVALRSGAGGAGGTAGIRSEQGTVSA